MSVKLLIYTLSMLVSLMPVAITNQKKSELFVLATLGRRHEQTTVYDEAKLNQIIESIKPDVLVLDVTPNELKEEKVPSGKIEYTNVVFPLIKREGYKVYAAEPDEPMFTEIVNKVKKSINDFDTSEPTASAALKRMTEDTNEVLKIFWKTPADVNNHYTDQLIQGRRKLNMRLNGTEDENKKWSQHTVDVVLRAIKENPGKRVLLLYGINYCFEIRSMMRSNKEINLVDMEKWLRDNQSLN